MKICGIYLIVFLSIGDLHAQNAANLNPEMDFFNSLEGSWEGIPKDTSFISILTYGDGNQKHFVFVNNDLLSKERKLFSHYEGVYFFNPNTSRIEYNTINKLEIHNGYCRVREDTLFHYATIKNKSEKIMAYTSAIIKLNENTMAYYAAYGKDEQIPDLEFENPLLYRKIDD